MHTVVHDVFWCLRPNWLCLSSSICVSVLFAWEENYYASRFTYMMILNETNHTNILVMRLNEMIGFSLISIDLLPPIASFWFIREIKDEEEEDKRRRQRQQQLIIRLLQHSGDTLLLVSMKRYFWIYTPLVLPVEC